MAVGLTKGSEKSAAAPEDLPGHLDLPEENGEFVQNFREMPRTSC